MDKLIALDKKVFEWLNKSVGRNVIIDDFWKITSVYIIYLIPFYLVYLWFANPKLREDSLRSAIVGVIGWLAVTRIIAFFWFRERPIADLSLPTKEIVFHRPTYSFPSDHALFLFALASGFYFAGHKEIGIGLYVVAIIISFSRVVVGIHFPLDVIVGAIIGIIIAWLAWQYRAQLDIILVKPFMAIAKFLKLG